MISMMLMLFLAITMIIHGLSITGFCVMASAFGISILLENRDVVLNMLDQVICEKYVSQSQKNSFRLYKFFVFIIGGFNLICIIIFSVGLINDIVLNKFTLISLINPIGFLMLFLTLCFSIVRPIIKLNGALND